MPCDLADIQSAACESGIGKITNPITLLQLTAQLTCESANPGAVWGTITGTLADQTDLQTALNAKAYNDFRAANYGGIAPVWVPTGTLGIAVDTVTEQIWWYYSGAWH